MGRALTAFVAAGLLVAGTAGAVAAEGGKRGGVLTMYHRDSPASASIHEEATFSTNIPFMGLYNNLVMYDQHKPQNTLETIVPDLATSWSWSPDQLQLTFKLRSGVKWHDGKPFSAKDVKCTFDTLMGKSKDLLRDMREKPVGTGPFKFVEFKQNESIKVVRNADYWKPGLPYLDGMEFTIIPNRSTAILAFIAGKFDMTFPTEVTIPLLKDIKSQAPDAVCEVAPMNVSTNLIVNRDVPPFDNADLRRAMAYALDRKAFNDILSEGKSDIGASMLPPPGGVWGMPKEMLETIPGYGPDVAANRAEARRIMEKLGYGANKRLAVKISTRNIPTYRDPAVILIDQLKDVYIDGELEVVETSVWHAKASRKDYIVGLNLTGNAVDDPDQNFYENYACGSERNFTGYCNKELDALFDKQSAETNLEARKKLVWDIDKKLAEDVARPIILHAQQATCWRPHVKNYTPMINSSYNGFRFEDVWLDK
jgi:peptide/nickel transport system substrate-binding protein